MKENSSDESASSNDGEAEEVYLEEILFLYTKKKWKARWCILCNGALLIKGKQEDQSSLKDILLKGCEVKKSEPMHKKDHVFSITTQYEEMFFALTEEKVLNDWIEKINDCKNKDVTVQTKKRKQGKLMRVSKSVGGKVATSSAGKKILRDMIGKDGVKIISIIKKVITDVYDKSKAKEVENDIIRIGVKFILLYRNEDITENDINQLKPRIQKLWHVCQDYAYIINFDYKPESIQESSNLVFALLIQQLTPLISQKNLEKINLLQSVLFSNRLLDHLYKDETMTSQRKLLADILERHYTV